MQQAVRQIVQLQRQSTATIWHIVQQPAPQLAVLLYGCLLMTCTSLMGLVSCSRRLLWLIRLLTATYSSSLQTLLHMRLVSERGQLTAHRAQPSLPYLGVSDLPTKLICLEGVHAAGGRHAVMQQVLNRQPRQLVADQPGQHPDPHMDVACMRQSTLCCLCCRPST